MIKSILNEVRACIDDRLLKEIHRAEARKQMREHRALLDRLENIGIGSMFHGRLHITCPERAIIGQNVHIGDNAFIRAEGGLRIGDNTHISRNLVLYTINHNIHGVRLPYDETYEEKYVEIGRNVWIGMNVCIAPGATIGDGAIIGMGATISGTVEPLSIVVGSKWRVIGERDSTHYRQLDEQGTYGGIDGRLFERTT